MAASDITVSKKIIFMPKTLTGHLKVRAMYVPKAENLPAILKPYVIERAINMFLGARKGSK